MRVRSKLVPVSEAARRLEIRSVQPSLWLIRRLKRLKSERGIDLLVRMNQSERAPRYGVHMKAVEAHLPELFGDIPEPVLSEAARMSYEAVGRKLTAIDDRIDEMESLLASIRDALKMRQATKAG